MVVDRLVVVAGERSDGECPSRVDGTEQIPLDLVVDHPADSRRIEVLLDETPFRGAQLDIAPDHLPPVGELSRPSVQVKTVEGAS